VQTCCILQRFYVDRRRPRYVTTSPTLTWRRRRHVVAAQKHETWMPKCQHLAHTCSSLERRQRRRRVVSCRCQRRYDDDDTSPRACRRRVKKTTRRANTSDKTTTLSAEITLKYIVFNSKRMTKTPCGRAEQRTKKTTRRANTGDKTTILSAENALKYIDFNTKRVIKTPRGRAERLTKRTCFRAEITSFTVQKRENWMPKWQHVAQTCCAQQRFYVVNADEMSCCRRRRDGGDDTSRTLRRRRVKKDNMSRNHYWQNDSVFAEIVDLFILLTLLHSTTFKTEVSTWPIAACAREHGSLRAWMDVRAWTIGIMCPSDALRDIDMWWHCVWYRAVW